MKLKAKAGESVSASHGGGLITIDNTRQRTTVLMFESVDPLHDEKVVLGEKIAKRLDKRSKRTKRKRTKK